MTTSKIESGFAMNEANEIAENAKLNARNKTTKTSEKTEKTEGEKKAKTVKAKAETPAEKAPAKVIDLAPIKANLPESVTPAYLDKAFQLNDGGKTVRRHLRKHFASDSAHEHKASWNLKPGDPVLDAILTHFASRYTFSPVQQAK